ncbi:GNAT family N-acetyltransferase [Yoonia sp.]|uniref:GNAT family N-acetyltransferase n=1 Tax=Yoonia sp. TaxID=2212373 RepID=UPI002FDB7FD5
MTLRPATAADAPQIAAIWNHAIRHTTITFNPVEKSDAEVADLCARQALVWEEGGRILGFSRFFQFRGGEGYKHTAEHTILLHADGQGRGMGRALMMATCDAARAAGYHSLFAGCSAENAGAVAFHAACGFRTVATLPEVGFKFGRWIDLVLMQKLL